MIENDASLLAQLPLNDVARVAFYKRDEISSDLICREVALGEEVWTFHEELIGWNLVLGHVANLPEFRSDWVESVSQPPFAPSVTLAFSRQEPSS